MKNKLKYLIFFLIIVVLKWELLYSQQPATNLDSSKIVSSRMVVKNSEGRDFWVCFEKNYKDQQANPSNELHLELFITGDENANVQITIDGIRYKQKFYIPARTVQNIKLPADAQVKSEEIKERLAVHITTDNPISVYGLNRRFQTTDTYLALPTEVLGTEYRVMCYKAQDDLLPQFAIIATEDNTEVVITTKVNTLNHQANTPFKVQMSKGDVYQVTARKEQLMKDDLTGSLISSNKKIAVFSGHQCAYVPANIIACNHLVEEMSPVPSWGKHFFIGRLKSRSYYSFRVLANEPNTRVFEDAKLTKTLNAGEYYEGMSKKNLQVTADKPILVAQYSQGLRNGDSVGDPMMILVSPTQQFLLKYRFATPISGSWKHFVNVVVPNRGINSMLLDGKPIDSKIFEQLGVSRYSIAYIQVPYGTHTLDGALPFGMYSYGFGFAEDEFDAYGTMGGQSFMDYIPALDTLPPMAEMTFKDNTNQIIFRDDRVDDSGLREVNIIENMNIDVNLSKLDPGSPQLTAKVTPLQRDAEGRVVFEATDIALNKSTFTVCYTFNPKSERMELSFSEGLKTDCSADPGFQIGAFFKLSGNFHNADFASSGNLHALGKFSDASGFGGYGGLSIGRRLSNKWLICAKVIFENFGGTLEAPDSITSHVRTPSGDLKTFQEARRLTLKGLFLNFDFGAEYYLNPYLYISASLNTAVPLSKSIDLKRQILIPGDYTYSNLSREITIEPGSLSSISNLKFSAGLGAGFIYPVSYKLSFYLEAGYNYPLNNIVNDASWKIHQLLFMGGIRYRI
jgi:hypothetical protein